jgi:hypothetical protein
VTKSLIAIIPNPEQAKNDPFSSIDCPSCRFPRWGGRPPRHLVP